MANLRVDCLELGMLPTNTYILWNADTRDCIVIDPSDGFGRLDERLKEKDLHPVAVYITEAQNFSVNLMKLALQRIGEETIVIIDGDYTTQVDRAEYAGSNNGMRRMSEVFRGYNLYGEVELKNIFRSEIARIADEM